MNLLTHIHTIDKRLRLLLLATAILLVPQIGQFIALRDLATAGRLSDLALLFMLTAIFIIPTSLILSTAILWTVRQTWREHRPLVLLGGLNIFIGLSLTWFFFHPCSWAAVFGLSIQSCH
jgi:hypothetical protein